MKIYSTYSVKIKHQNKIFSDTVSLNRSAVDFYIQVILQEWSSFSTITSQIKAVNLAEKLSVKTAKRTAVPYDFGKNYYKFPSYLRRAAIAEAYGKVCSYQSNLKNWETLDTDKRGKKPTLPKAGYVYPAMYRDNCFVRTGTYTASLKVWIRNTWDWVDVELKKSDVDYILRRCADRKECVPTLQKRGKEWFLDFSFEEKVELCKPELSETIILGVDLGLNNACTCSAMKADGTILGRRFLSLPRETDSLQHSINRIKKAQQHGNRKTPRLWAKAEGINDRIAVLTAQFIIDTAVFFNADTIVFEALDLSGKKKGNKKQKLHHWKARYVQSMVTDKAHRLGIHVNHVCAWNTSRLAFDGSGRVLRGSDANLKSYSECRFQNGKIYNCDLNASYNIGSRYLIREMLKSLTETSRLEVLAKVPELSKRSTCTLSSLINLNAVLAA